jgi:hypothetical protein
MKIKFKKPFSIAGLITATILAVLLILFIGAYSKRGAFSSIDFFEGKETIIESQNKDTDNDGIKDWEEDLLKTDPTNPDTDNDGFLDGEEMNSGHNPLVKSPGDTQVFYPMPLGEKYNITNKLLSDENINILVASYLSQKEEYLEDHPQITEENFTASVEQSTVQKMWERALGDLALILGDSATEEIEKMPEVFNININDNDIKISEDNSDAIINDYLSQVSSMLNTDNFLLQEEAANAIDLAMTGNDFSKLDTLIKENDAKIEEAKNIIVPSSWIEIHKEGMEITILVRNIYLSFRNILNDPFKAFVAFKKLEGLDEYWENLMTRAIDLAASQGITISIQE